MASNFDVLRAEVELSNFTAELIRSRNAINVAKVNLVKIMGVSQDSSFALSDELVYSPLNITMEQAVASAYRNRPDLFSKELGVRQQMGQRLEHGPDGCLAIVRRVCSRGKHNRAKSPAETITDRPRRC